MERGYRQGKLKPGGVDGTEIVEVRGRRFVYETFSQDLANLASRGPLGDRVTELENKQLKILYYVEIDGGQTSGQISVPEEATILFNQWANGVDAVVSNIVDGKPDYKDTGVDVLNIDTSGNYTLSDTLDTNPAAFIFYLTIEFQYSDNLNQNYIIEYIESLYNPVDYIQFNTLYSEASSTVGVMKWNSDEKTIDLILPNGVIAQLAQESFIGGINQTGSDIAEGTPVMFSGAVGASGKLTMQLAIADGSFNPDWIMGVVTEAIVDGNSGKVTWFGKVRSINTTGIPYGETWNEGDLLYVSPTISGRLTNIKPSAPNYTITVAAVVNVHAINGTIIVRPSWNTKLVDLADVYAPIKSDGDILYFNSANNRFEISTRIRYIPASNLIQLGDIVGGNYTEFNAKGELRSYGDATQWDDLKFPFTRTRVGALNKPDFDYTNLGLLFPQNDATEIVYIIGQMPHEYKEGSNIRPHIHWQQSAATAVTWVMEYKWFNNNSAIPAAFTTISTNTGAFTYTSGNLAQISSFPEIDGTGKFLSSLLLIKIYRNDNTTTGDVPAFEFDIHYEIDSNGSNGEFTKYTS